MAAIALKKFCCQQIRINQIAVVPQGQTIGRIHVEGLGFGRIVAARGGIAHMADADVALQALHLLAAKHIGYQAITLVQVQPVTIEGGDAHEDTRLKYRYLDLRRAHLQSNLVTRHKAMQAARRYLDRIEEITETPVQMVSVGTRRSQIIKV